MPKKKAIAMILAGGQGTRLGALTKTIAKPAVPFGGKYRIILVDKGDILVNGVRRPLVPFPAGIVRVGRQHKNAAIFAVQIPGTADPHIAVEEEWLILGQDAHGVDPGVAAVRQRKINDPVFSAKGNRRLGDRFRQGSQPGSLPTGQNHRNGFLFRHVVPPFRIRGCSWPFSGNRRSPAAALPLSAKTASRSSACRRPGGPSASLRIRRIRDGRC